MIKESITLQEVVDFLNDLLKVDQLGVNCLFNIRVFCNNDMANHATVQVGKVDECIWQFGVVGLLNGLFGIDAHHWGHLSVQYDASGKIEAFEMLTEERVREIIKNAKEETK